MEDTWNAYNTDSTVQIGSALWEMVRSEWAPVTPLSINRSLNEAYFLVLANLFRLHFSLYKANRRSWYLLRPVLIQWECWKETLRVLHRSHRRMTSDTLPNPLFAVFFPSLPRGDGDSETTFSSFLDDNCLRCFRATWAVLASNRSLLILAPL